MLRSPESAHMGRHVGRIGCFPMTAEERLAELTAGDRRRQARRRDALRQKGMVQQSVWLSAQTRDLIDQAIEEGRFKNRSEAVDWALASSFAKEKTMS